MNSRTYQRIFLSRIGSLRPFQQLIDLLPDVAFFVKDRAGRFVLLNRRSCEYCRLDSEEKAVGKTDYEFFPYDRAVLYAKGDRQVMKSGKPVINSVEPAPEESGSDRLIISSKFPLKDRKGRIIGIAGIHREIEGLRAAPKSYGRLSLAIRHMHACSAQPLSTRQLAGMVGISTRQFDRLFRRLFGTTPRQYLLRLRINAACRLLVDATRSVTDVAMAAGFYDHSHFSRSFHRLMGTSPMLYRRRHRMEE